MTARTVAADVLLGLAAIIVLGSCVGIAVMRDVYQKLHYVTPAAIVAPLLVGMAVLVESGWSIDTVQTWLALVLVAVAAPYLSHATIRAARIRDAGDWRSVTGAGGSPRDRR